MNSLTFFFFELPDVLTRFQLLADIPSPPPEPEPVWKFSNPPRDIPISCWETRKQCFPKGGKQQLWGWNLHFRKSVYKGIKPWKEMGLRVSRKRIWALTRRMGCRFLLHSSVVWGCLRSSFWFKNMSKWKCVRSEKKAKIKEVEKLRREIKGKLFSIFPCKKISSVHLTCFYYENIQTYTKIDKIMK